MLKRGAICRLLLSQVYSCRLSSTVIAETEPVKIKAQKPPKKEQKPSKQVEAFFEAENEAILRLFPTKLLRAKQKTPESFYVCHQNAVEMIAKHLNPRYDKNGNSTPLIEVNPGAGMLTNALIQKGFHNMLLFESNDTMVSHLKKLVTDNISLSHTDFLGLWKLVYQDKLDQGGRVPLLLKRLKKLDWNDDFTAQIFGSVGSLNFIKHLINSIVFQSSLLSYGRCEMVLCIPPPLYIHLTCSKKAGYLLYRGTTMLFQIMFEHEFLGKIPFKYFLPWQASQNLSSRNKLTKVQAVDPDYMYLVKIVPRKELYDLCPAEHMQALWYFVKQHCTSRKNRIIPMLERWIPGCGVRLITNNTAPVKTKLLNPNDQTTLPCMSVPATTMTTEDFFPNINIFTQFGDLSPSQMLTLFHQFRNWPEYQDSPFMSAMEASYMKMEQSSEPNADGIAEEDDVSAGDSGKKL